MPDPFFIHTFTDDGVGGPIISLNAQALTSTAWGTANLALFIPFTITERHTYVRACVCNGATVAGNFDVGVYRGTARLFSTGTTAQAGVSQMQVVTGLSWTLDPGDYYLALATNSTTATFMCGNIASGGYGMAVTGGKQQTTAFVLPNPATLANYATVFVPLFGIFEKTWV